MYVKLKIGKQKEILKKSIKQAGSQRKLAKIIKIPKSIICDYLNGRLMTEIKLSKIINFLGIKCVTNLIESKLSENWRQVLGGKNCVISKKNKGTFSRDMDLINQISSRKLKEWHQNMKKTEPELYYKIQNSRFKKMLGYKCRTINGEKVRNIWEKQIADILLSLGIKYEYVPLIRTKDRYFFPDFLINKKIILECTMWKGIENSFKLKDKIIALEETYNIFVIIPKNLKSYYKVIESNLIIGLDEFARVAQTFHQK